MVRSAPKPPVKARSKEVASEVAERAPAPQAWHPFESLRREVDRLFEDFGRDVWRPAFGRPLFDIEPFMRRELPWGGAPAVDIVEKDDAWEVTAEVPGMEEKDIEVTIAGGALTIKGHKQQDKEEKKKGYHLRERRFGSFERRFPLPEGVDTDRSDATFRKGVLTVTLPKKPEARKPGKQIKVKSG
ncbi:MAG TPA: Hsp20/alpha crystallin family protein [Zeimonas sp.]|nr:Hsp20/alpha crystallin family protein [Zeimonas sp.]